MALAYQTKNLDSCECIFTEQYDDTHPPAFRLYSLAPNAPFLRCPQHAGITDNAQLYKNLITENRRKNRIIMEIMTRFPAWTETLIDADGQAGVWIQKGRAPKLSWSAPVAGAERVLTITLPNKTNAQRTALQTAVDNLFGAGKVIIA
jgi:hypothetical protein